MGKFTAYLNHKANRGGTTVAVWRDCYADTLEYIDHLKDILLQDFPNANPAHFQAKVYGGPQYKRMLALEYTLPRGEAAPTKYERGDLPPTV